jgi:hypothetical protein
LAVSVVFIGMMTCAVLLLRPDGIARVTLGTTTFAIPLPSPAIQLRGGPGHATYFVVGDGKLGDTLRQGAGDHGWRYIEQLGSMHDLQKAGWRAQVVRRQWATSFLIIVDVDIRPSPPSSRKP